MRRGAPPPSPHRPWEAPISGHARVAGRRLVLTFALSLLMSLGVVSAAAAEPATLTDARREAAALQEQIDHFNDQLETIMEDYAEAQWRLQVTQTAIAAEQAKLERAERDLSTANSRLANRIADIYRNGRFSLIEAVFEAKDFSDFINRLSLLSRVGAADRDVVNQISKYREEVAARRQDLSREKAEAEQLVRRARASKAAVEKKLAERKAMLAGKEKLIAELEKQERERQARLEAEVRAAAARRAQEAAAQEAARAPAQARPAKAPKVSGGAPPARNVPRSRVGDTVVDIAMQYLGVPYVWGGASPDGFDCSGLVMYVYGKVGVSLPHSSRAQFGMGVPVSRDALQPGDLVFFGNPIHHVGIYVGGGNMIHAPYTGANVRINSIDRGNYTGARRIL
ncbi:MAG: C40 family peptidase [Thermoleophilia bacterium]